MNWKKTKKMLVRSVNSFNSFTPLIRRNSFIPFINSIPRRMFNPYEILNLPVNANDQQIKRRFQELTQQHHPDLHPNDPFYSQITEAYTILSNPKMRTKYDLSKLTQPVFLDYKTPYKQIIDVGIGRNFPEHINNILKDTVVIGPNFAGVPGFLLSAQPFIEGVITNNSSPFDLISLVGWMFIGWGFKPKVVVGDKFIVVEKLFNDNVKIEDGIATCGNETICKITNQDIDGMVKGNVITTKHYLYNSSEIVLNKTKIYETHIKLGILDIFLFMKDGFSVGVVIQGNFFGWKFFKTFFNYDDAEKIIALFTIITSKLL